MTKTRRFTRFEDWHSHDVEAKLGIRLVEHWPPLLDWVSSETRFPSPHHEWIEALRQRLLRQHSAWNEMELQLNFIGPLLHTVRLYGEGFDSFAQRSLSAQIGVYKVQGIVDWMTATGSYQPEKPYFFLHEYKRQKAAEADPLGQLLISMVAAQTLNADGLSVYGSFVIGRYWSFVLLQGNEYGFSEGFDCLTEAELGRVWHTLHATRERIAERVAAPSTAPQA